MVRREAALRASAALAALAIASLGATLTACPGPGPGAASPGPVPSAGTSTSPSGVASTPVEPPPMVRPPAALEDADGEALLAAHESDPPFQIRFEGPPLEGQLSKKPCAYYEWTHGEGRDPSSYARGFQSDGQLVAAVRIGGLPFRVGFSWRKLRPYVAPSFERQARFGEPWVPSVVRADLGGATQPVWVLEHCLEIGADYYARVGVETYSLPPRGPGQRPGQGRNRVLLVSDRPFVDGRPQGGLTPGFRAWSY